MFWVQRVLFLSWRRIGRGNYQVQRRLQVPIQKRREHRIWVRGFGFRATDFTGFAVSEGAFVVYV